MSKRVAVFAILVAGLSVGCSKLASSSSVSDVSATPTPSANGVQSNSPFPYDVSVGAAWEGPVGGTGPTAATSVITDCQLTSSNTPPYTLTCTGTLPQGQLHFSYVFFTTTVGRGNCAISTFQPYYYLASNQANFLPSWLTTAIDCSATPKPVGCYSGPATEIVPQFPLFKGMYTLAVNGPFTYKATSSNLKLRQSNRYISNNLPLGSRGNAVTIPPSEGDGYVVNSMVDYQFVCYDLWYQPLYTVNLTISDSDTSAGGSDPNNPNINRWPDWDSPTVLGMLQLDGKDNLATLFQSPPMPFSFPVAPSGADALRGMVYVQGTDQN